MVDLLNFGLNFDELLLFNGTSDGTTSKTWRSKALQDKARRGEARQD